MSVAMRDSYERTDTPERTTTGLQRVSDGTTRTVSNNGGYTTYGNNYGTTTNIRTGTPERDNIRSSQVIRNGGLITSTTYVNGGTTSYNTGGYTRTSQIGGGYTSNGVRTSQIGGGYTSNGVRTSNGYVTRTSQIGTTYPGKTTTTEYSSSRQLSPHVTSVNRNVRASHVIGFKEGQSRFLEERYVGERVVNVTTHALEERVISSNRREMKSYVNEVDTYEDEPVIQERIVEKEVEVIVEKRVPVERYVDVEYDVIVEKPIEKIIEKEIEIEKIMEREIEKIIEVPIERIVEIPIERLVEKRVEIEKRVEVPYERVVERKVEDIYENLVYHDNYMDIDINDLHR